MAVTVFTSLLFTVSGIMDIKFRRIPNWLTIPACLAGLGYHAATGGLITGAVYALKGFGAGLVLLMIPFLLRYTGGGDVKLLAAAGSWLGVTGIVNLFLYGSIAGGVMALGLIIMTAGTGQAMNILFFPSTLMKTLSKKVTGKGVPYAAAMGIGFVCYLAAGPIV